MNILNIGGIPYTGTTLMGCMLGSMNGAIFLGEMETLFKDRSKVGCIQCGTMSNCTVWKGLNFDFKNNRTMVYRVVEDHFKKFMEDNTTLITSSKGVLGFSGRDNPKSVVMFKIPHAVAFSTIKHSNVNLEFFLKFYVKAYKIFLKFKDIGYDLEFVLYKDFCENTDTVVKWVCDKYSIDFSDNYLRFWDFKKQLHFLGGNSGTGLMLLNNECIEHTVKSEYWNRSFGDGDYYYNRSKEHRITRDIRFMSFFTDEQKAIIESNDAMKVYEELLNRRSYPC